MSEHQDLQNAILNVAGTDPPKIITAHSKKLSQGG